MPNLTHRTPKKRQSNPEEASTGAGACKVTHIEEDYLELKNLEHLPNDLSS